MSDVACDGGHQYTEGDQSLAMGLIHSKCYKNKTR